MIGCFVMKKYIKKIILSKTKFRKTKFINNIDDDFFICDIAHFIDIINSKMLFNFFKYTNNEF